MNKIDLIAFHKSIAYELDVVRNRVRNLIGSKHWVKEGEYKEAILKNVIKRFLPKNYSIGTGFVIANYGDNSYLTTQIDIIIYDNSYPTLFQEGDFVIVQSQAVRAIVEVKSRINTTTEFGRIVRKIINNAKVIRESQGTIFEINPQGIPEEKPQELFVGLFSYEAINTCSKLYDTLRDIFIKERDRVRTQPFERYIVNNIALSKDTLITFTKYTEQDKRLTLYNMQGLSYPSFIIGILRSLSFLQLYMGSGVWYPYDQDKFIVKSTKL